MNNLFKRCLPLLSLTAVLLLGGCAGSATRESTGEYFDDDTITAKVKASLIADSSVKALDVHVHTFKGVVQLSGFVNSEGEKAQAGRDAAQVTGVKDVQNNISVK